MRSRQLALPGATGEPLSARLDLPADGEPLAYALFAHCFTCAKELNAVVNISRALTQARCAVLHFDFTGLAANEGASVADLVTAARYLEGEGLAPSILIGHSLGGAAVIRAAARIPSVQGVVTISAPFDPRDLAHRFEQRREGVAGGGGGMVDIGRRPFEVSRQLLDDLKRENLEHDLRELNRPLLILHSPMDQVVGIQHAEQIFQAAQHPKSLISLDQANHLLTEERDSCYVATVLAGWASRYLPQPPPRVAEDPARGDRVVTVTGRTPYRTEVLAGGHALVVDEPLRLGGQDTGPTPYDLLLTALGTCTGITLRMYADRKGWPLEEITVRLRHHKERAPQGEPPASGEVRVDHIQEILELRGPLDVEQRTRLAEISSRCPVYKTLKAGVQIETRLATEQLDDVALHAGTDPTAPSLLDPREGAGE